MGTGDTEQVLRIGLSGANLLVDTILHNKSRFDQGSVCWGLYFVVGLTNDNAGKVQRCLVWVGRTGRQTENNRSSPRELPAISSIYCKGKEPVKSSEIKNYCSYLAKNLKCLP